MKKFFLIALATLSCGFAIAGEVVVPQDNTPFEVQKGDTVRIPVKGIAGTDLKVKVTGPAKEEINSVIPRVQGKVMVGPGNKEVELKTTGKGKVVVELTITPPGGKAEEKKYEFEVK